MVNGVCQNCQHSGIPLKVQDGELVMEDHTVYGYPTKPNSGKCIDSGKPPMWVYEREKNTPWKEMGYQGQSEEATTLHKEYLAQLV